MPEFEVEDRVYRSRKLCAVDQHHLLERLKPALPAFRGMDTSLRVNAADIADITIALAPLISASDDHMRAVFRACLAACEVRDASGTWHPILEAPPIGGLMRIVSEVVAENLSPLFEMERPKFRPIPTDFPAYEAVAMPDNEAWLFRPALRGLCRIESLYDGTLRIEHIAKANDVMDVEEENQARARRAAEKK